MFLLRIFLIQDEAEKSSDSIEDDVGNRVSKR